MPITCYFGPPGSGKSYELVNRVIVEAVKQGRTVYHNIPGINADQWAGEFGCDPDTLRLVPDSWFTDENNFPANDEEFAQGIGCLKGGELIVCDEASTIVPKGTGRNNPVTARIDSFYRKHRHFTADVKALNGKVNRIAVDMYFATQDSQSLYQTLLHLTALRVDFEELKGVFGAGAYRAIVYKSHRATKANRWGRPKLRKTDKRGYARYHSFAGGVDGQTASTEDTAKVWTKGRLFMIAAVTLLVVGGATVAVKQAVTLFTIKPVVKGSAVSQPSATAHFSRSANGSFKFDAGAAINGECVRSILDVEGRSYFDGESWKQAEVRGDRWVLGNCSVAAP